jgi:SAM-dependent methyltransferase
MKPAITIREESIAVQPTPLWQAAAAQCPLCGSRRRDYLFVVGQSRMTRCHECSLICGVDGSGNGAPREASSYLLDAAAEESLRAGLSGRVLQITFGGQGQLMLDPGVPQVGLVLPKDAQALESLEPRSFDSAFVNGVVEQVRDPVALLRQVRAALKPEGNLSLVVGSGDLARLPSDEAKLPRFVFRPATLLRLAIAAGFDPRACGLLARPLEGRVDERIDLPVRFSRIHHLLGAMGKKTAVESGLLELRAKVAGAPRSPRLSILMPVFNEARTFRGTFDRVAAWRMDGLEREIVVIESNSTDGSRELVRAIEREPGVRVIYQDHPRGKGHAVRAGLRAASGDIVLIQDADSEYDVSDYDIVLEPLLRLSATFVLGSRHMGGRTWKIRKFADFRALSWLMNLAHEFFTRLANWVYDAEVRDPTTMYKVFRRECVEGVAFRRDRFDFDWELVCKLMRHGHMPVEVPINYRSRSYAEGKKVRFFRDPLTWLAAILSSRFEPLR